MRLLYWGSSERLIVTVRSPPGRLSQIVTVSSDPPPPPPPPPDGAVVLVAGTSVACRGSPGGAAGVAVALAVGLAVPVGLGVAVEVAVGVAVEVAVGVLVCVGVHVGTSCVQSAEPEPVAPSDHWANTSI
jgi:hypothetical protein